MKIEVLMEYMEMIESDSRLLIVSGGMMTGKFYAACQKLIHKCLLKYTRAAIYCDNIEYAASTLKKILGENCVYSRSLMAFMLGDGSRIDIINRANLEKLSSYNMTIIKCAEYIDVEVFNAIKRKTRDQIILTCIPPEDTNHWLYQLAKENDCIKIDVERADMFKLPEYYNES